MTVAAGNTDPRPRGAKATQYAALLDAPDQASVRADLATFFGPHAEVYLATYDKMRAASGGRRLMPSTWSWPVFLGGFTWFFYRKMYAHGAAVLFLPLVFGYLLGSSGGAMSIVFAIWAKGFYVQAAFARIIKADKLGLTGTERSDYLARAGGVSLVAGLFAGTVYVCLIVLAIAAVFLRHRAVH